MRHYFGKGIVICTYIWDRAAKGGEVGDAIIWARKFTGNIGTLPSARLFSRGMVDDVIYIQDYSHLRLWLA